MSYLATNFCTGSSLNSMVSLNEEDGRPTYFLQLGLTKFRAIAPLFMPVPTYMVGNQDQIDRNVAGLLYQSANTEGSNQ